MTLPSEPLIPWMRCSPRPAKNRSMTGPTLRVYVYSMTCGARSTSLVAIRGRPSGAVRWHGQLSYWSCAPPLRFGARSNGLLPSLPVGVAQLALVELAVGVARQLGHEVDGLGELVPRQS